jgi:hypothetical protein
MAARFERYVYGSTAWALFARVQGFDLCVVAAETPMVTLADDVPILHHHTPDHRIRLDATFTPPSNRDSPVHHAGIKVVWYLLDGILGRILGKHSLPLNG